MASSELNEEPRKRANSFPENIIRKVTIQQTVVEPANAAIAQRENVDCVQRYPRGEYHDASNRGLRGKYPVKHSRGVVMKNVNGLELKRSGERNFRENTSRAGERDLWEKAVNELELVIAGKDTVIENLSKVNNKLSGDIRWYDGSLQDCKNTLREVEEKLKQTTGVTTDKEWYEGVLKEREDSIRELEEKLEHMAKPKGTRDKRSLELSQGAKSVLKNLELKKEKTELERKVGALEEQLKQQKTETLRQELPGDLKENNPSQPDKQFFKNITSSLREFQLTIERKLNEKEKMVTDLHTRLSCCNLKFEKFSEKVRKLSLRTSQHDEGTISRELNLKVSSSPELIPRDLNPEEIVLRDNNSVDLNQKYVNPGDLSPGDSNRGELDPEESEQVNILKAALQKERKINDEIIERFLELEEANKRYEYTVEELRGKANLVDDLRTQNKDLIGNKDILEERKGPLDAGLDNLDGTEEPKDTEEQKVDSNRMVKMYEGQLNSLRSFLESQENETRELREKAGEDDELIEELRANFQREEKWNREMQKKYEWELSSSASKDDRIEELEDCLWTREKTLRQLREQLEFEDKRCEELLEKLVASQKEAQEFEEIVQCFQRKLDDKDKRITEFCEQNDRDAIAIGNLSSENERLRNEVVSVTKARMNLEEDLEKLSSSLETAQQSEEKVVMRKEKDLQNISNQLREEELTSKSKDEVIERLQENVVSLSADVEEMEFRIEEGRGSFEEKLNQAKKSAVQLENELSEAAERYSELEDVCESLREKICQKGEEVLEREADIASQREVIENREKQIEELREMCGDTSTRLNDKPALVYTEAEMSEVSQFLEQERGISEDFRTQIELLNNEVKNSKDSFLEIRRNFETESEAQRKALTTTREELHARNNLLNTTCEELHAMNIAVLKHKGILIAKEKEMERYKENSEALRLKLKDLDKEKQGLETTVEGRETKLSWASGEIRKLTKENEELKDVIATKVECMKKGESVNEELKEKLENQTAKCLKNEEELRLSRVNNVNLKYSLEEYISQSREINRNLKNHEREVVTLTEYIEEMNTLINGFRSALEEAVRKENANEVHSYENDDLQTSITNENRSDLPMVYEELGASTVDTLESQMTSGVMNETVLSFSSKSQGEKSHDKTNGANPLVQQNPNPMSRANSSFHNNDIRNNDLNHLRTEISNSKVATHNDQASSLFFKNLYHAIPRLYISKNRNLFLVLGFLIFVFFFGCMNNSIVSRKYLFIVANSIISLTMFVLWRDEVRKNKSFRYFSPTSALKEHKTAKFQENGCLPRNSHEQFNLFSETIQECQHCGNAIMERQAERLHFTKIKSSFQELHEKFLEAVENSSKDTLPMRELYKEYEKLKDEVEAMRENRLNDDSTLTPHSEEEDDREKDSLSSPKWKRIILNLGRVLMIVLLWEMFYIRNSSLPRFVSQITFLLSSWVLSYLCDYVCVVREGNADTRMGQNEMEIAQEIDELNEIIDKEHELVITQREAIKALEKRLRKEFERRIKQRNVLLKKLKYKGKLEDLRELMDERDGEDKKGDEVGSLKDNDKGNEDYSRDRHISKVAESDRMGKLQDILTKFMKQSATLNMAFSPMFFFLGIPLTGIMLSCRHLMLAAVMILLQLIVFLKENKYIEAENFFEFSQKEINPIIMDTAVVLFACLLAVSLQCSQGIMVLITCSIVQLSVYWWSSYKLAKTEDTLDEISKNCLPSNGKE